MENNNINKFIQSKWTIIGAILFVVIIVGIKILTTIKATTTSAIPIPTPIAGSSGAYPTTSPKIITSQLSFFHYDSAVNINLDSGGDAVSGVQLAISYDPKVLTNIQIVPATYFNNPTILVNKVDTEKGIITYTVVIKPDDSPIKGKGTVVAITYDKVSGSQGQTKISFLPETKVTSQGVNTSVLQKTQSITIPL